MRLYLSRVLSAICLVAVALVLWTALSFSHGTGFTQTCHHPEEFQDRLHELTDRTHEILSKLNILHALCYGALWGQVRISRSLPWEADAEFCLLNEQLSAHDEVQLVRVFASRGLSLNYDSSEGRYLVEKKGNPGPSVQLVVFEEDPLIGMLRRVGWKRRLLPPDCESMASLDCFPPRLLTPPLPQKEFGGYVVPVPREGIEIQKYHYRDNWWKEVMPKNC